MNRGTALSALLVLVLVSHLLLGGIAYLAPGGTVMEWAGRAYGAELELVPQTQHVIRMLGAYMLAMGVLAALALTRAAARGGIVLGIVALLALRVLQRLVFAREINETFNVSLGQLWLQSAFFAALAVALFLLRPREGGQGAG